MNKIDIPTLSSEIRTAVNNQHIDLTAARVTITLPFQKFVDAYISVTKWQTPQTNDYLIVKSFVFGGVTYVRGDR